MGKRWWIWSGLVVMMASSPALAQEPVQERFRLVVRHAIIFGCGPDPMTLSSTTCRHRSPDILAVTQH